MKRFLSILLALILALSLLPMQAMAATVISSVAVTLDAPVVGASPDYTTVLPTGAHYYSDDYSGNYTRNDVQWNEADTNTWLLLDSAVFQAGHQYRVMVFLTPEDGYEFAGATTATLNGQAASAYYLSSGQLEVVYTFPAASEPVISSVAVTLDAPAVGASPDYTAIFPAGVHYYSDEFNGTFLRNDIQWKDVTANTWMNPDSAVFQSGHEYMVSLYLTAQSGFSFGGDLTAAVNGQTASASMGGSQLAVTYVFPALPDLSSCATVILTAEDVWGDGSGYQMLLDADATAYGILIPEVGGLSDYGSDAPAGLYDEFEYKIPENADGSLTTQNIVINNSVSIQIPAGTYDYCITNPTPGDKVWIVGSSGSAAPRGDNFVFEAGKTYEFTVSSYGSGDGVDLVITGSPDLTGVPASVTSLSAQVSSEAITLTWPAAANAAFYRVARHEYGSPWETLAENVTANSYVDSGAEPGYAYAYRVWACNDQGAAAPAESDYVTIPLQLPGAISSVSAQVSAGKIIVTWSAAENADCYMVARQVAGSPWVILSSDVTGTSFEDSTVEAGQSYIYLVEGRNSHGYGDYTLSESVTFVASKPGDIVSVTATAEPELITVTWPEAEYAARYVVARQVSGASGWTVLDNDVTENLYEDDDVEAGKTYRYRVRAYNAQGSGAAANSEYVTVPASKPGDVVSVTADAEAESIIVTWPEAAYAAWYVVARQVSGASGWTVLDSNVTDNLYEDNDVEAGKSYRYRVRAYNDQGSGGAADSAYVTALAAKPGDIASVTATASAGKITVSWPAAAYAARYVVARQVSGASTWTVLDENITDNSYEDSAAEAGKSYRYRVRAYNAQGSGAAANSAYVTAK